MQTLKFKLEELYKKIEQTKQGVLTEEATKMAFIIPFLQILGYDVFNPMEVVPEYIADIGTKKGEKADYLIKKNGQPIIIVECKHWKENATAHNSQLLRYFHVTNARFGVMTNGIVYNFFTDLEKLNIMDVKPFLSIDLSNLQDSDVIELKMFVRDNFNIDTIYKKAQTLRYKEGLRSNLAKEIANPSYDFVKVLSKGVFFGHPKGYEWDEFNNLAKEVIQEKFK